MWNMSQAKFPRLIIHNVTAFRRLSLRPWVAVLVVVSLTQMTGNMAWGLKEVDYLNSDIGKNLETVGRIVENPAKTESIITGKETSGTNSPFALAIFGLIHLSTPIGAYATTPLSPANN